MRHFIDISYFGKAYAGWQIQQNAHTVQAELDQALSTLLRKEIRSTGAGRTDTGVHARQLMVHFEHEEALPASFLHSINGLLPADISVNQLLKPVKPDLHARFDASHRSYIYQIVRKKSPFHHDFAYWLRTEVDVAKMQAGAELFKGYTEFGSFCKANAANLTNICRIDHAYWQEEGELLCFHIGADRFLRGMVRAVVGTLLMLGKGKISLAEFQAIIEAQDRRAAGPSAEAKGLFLTEVRYPEGSFQ
ncbi:MAG: tRNA pseudouridine(38-40) synthase TruA [Bacteroidota bacterium]